MRISDLEARALRRLTQQYMTRLETTAIKDDKINPHRPAAHVLDERLGAAIGESDGDRTLRLDAADELAGHGCLTIHHRDRMDRHAHLTPMGLGYGLALIADHERASRLYSGIEAVLSLVDDPQASAGQARRCLEHLLEAVPAPHRPTAAEAAAEPGPDADGKNHAESGEGESEGTTAGDACQVGGLPLACVDCGTEIHGSLSGDRVLVTQCSRCDIQGRRERIAAAGREENLKLKVQTLGFEKMQEADRADKRLRDLVLGVAGEVATGVTTGLVRLAAEVVERD